MRNETIIQQELSVLRHFFIKNSLKILQRSGSCFFQRSESFSRFPEQLPFNAKSWIDDQEGETEAKKEKIKVYPNPSESDVTLEFEEAKQVNGRLYDGMGRLVRTFETDGEETQYKINGLSHGIYNLRLMDSNGETETKRIIIK